MTTQGVSQRIVDAFLGEGSQGAVVEKKENTKNPAIEPIAELKERRMLAGMMRRFPRRNPY